MAGALGENYKAYISVESVLTEIACQGDLTINSGKSLEISRTKNCKHPFFRDAGFTAQFTIEMETPMHATHAALLAAADAQTAATVAVYSSDAGVPRWDGDAYVAWDPLTAPTEGPVTFTITLAFADDPDRTIPSGS